MRILSTLAIAALAVALTSCQGKQGEKSVQPLRVTTEVATATTDYLRTAYVGTVEAQSSTPVSFVGIGNVTRIHVQEGQRVSKGQLIAELDDTQPRNMLATAQAQMDQANDALVRMKQLHDAGSLPDIKWIEVQSQVSQAKSQLAMAEKNLADCRIYAPVSGIISTRYGENGMTALTAMPIVSILDVSRVKVRVAIPEREIGAIHATTPCTVSVEALGRTFEGGRIEKGVMADATTHTYDILVQLPNSDGALLPGMIANVTLRTGAGSDAPAAITLPVRSVQQDASGTHFVWTVADGKAHRTTVTLGATTADRIVIATGLKGGEHVITKGYQKVGEGSAVIL